MPSAPHLILDEVTDAPPPRFKRWIVLAALLFIAFLIVHNAVPLYTDFLWFKEVGYTNVFSATIAAKLMMFAVCGAAFFGLLYGNVWYARRMASEQGDRLLMQRFGPQWGGMLQRGLGWILLLATGFFSLWAGRMGAEQWANWLEFTHGVPFHAADPVFHNDIGFYVFRLPFLNFVYGFLLITILLTLAAVVAVHVADRAIESFAGLPDVRPGARGQVLLLAALATLVQAFGTFLSRYDLLFNENGGFVGAGYADLHYRLFALNAQFVLLVITAILCAAAMFKFRLAKLAVGGAVAWVAAMILLGSIIPSLLQKAVVAPNEFSMESEYIGRNIAATRQGFGLTNVRNVDGFPADESLNAAGLRANSDTLDNIRLWDYDYLAKVYAQTDTVKTYYKFAQMNLDGSQSQNIDIDRYPINGKMRQVMLGAREMDSAALPGAAQTWQNRRLSYTHGYGLAMSPVNAVTDGLPNYFLQGFPPQAQGEALNPASLTSTKDARHPTPDTRYPSLQITRPQIYFGQLTQDYVFVNSTQDEFDYPATDAANGAGGLKDHYTKYAGKGGIQIGDSEIAKLAFSMRLGDANILLSRNFKPETRVLIRRDIRERIQTVAPFVQQDRDPYLVATDDGKLILDCGLLHAFRPLPLFHAAKCRRRPADRHRPELYPQQHQGDGGRLRRLGEFVYRGRKRPDSADLRPDFSRPAQAAVRTADGLKRAFALPGGFVPLAALGLCRLPCGRSPRFLSERGRLVYSDGTQRNRHAAQPGNGRSGNVRRANGTLLRDDASAATGDARQYAGRNGPRRIPADESAFAH